MSRLSLIRSAFLLLGLTTTAMGCHGRFKQHADTLGSVHAQTIVTGGPTVRVPSASTGSSFIDAVANVGVAVGAATTAGKIRGAVDLTELSGAMDASVADAIADGPPFAHAARDASGGLMQVDIRDFGVDASRGVPDFRFNGVVKIYRAQDGWRVYRSRFRCSSRAGTYNAGGLIGIGQSAAGLIQLAEMSEIGRAHV